MKILYHHRIRSKDGQYVHVEEMIEAMRRLGHEVIVSGPAGMAEEEFGGESRLLARLRTLIPRALYELLEFGYAVIDFLRLSRAVREHRPDFIYERYNLFLPSGIWVKRRFNVPLILEVNAPLYHERSRYGGLALDGLARWTERYAWRGADRVVCVTRVLADMVQAEGVPADRLDVTPNGLNLQRFKVPDDVDDRRRRHGLDGKLVLGFTGFVRAWHGLDRVLDVLARPGQPVPHLLVVGDGPAREALEARARELGVEDRLTILGVVDRDSVAGYVALFDIALQPDVVAYASPLKLFEYMGLRRPIVAPATDNVREILTDGRDAVLFDRNRPGAFVEAVERLLDDDDLRRRLGDAAGEALAAGDYTWEHNARRVVDMAGDLVPAPVATQDMDRA